MEQQELPLHLRVREVLAAEGRVFLRLLSEVVTVAGPKVVAEALSIEPSHLSQALSGRGKHFAAEWVLVLMIRFDPDGRVLRYMCRTTGYVVPQKAHDLPAEEFRARAQRVLSAHGAPGLAFLAEILNEEEGL